MERAHSGRSPRWQLDKNIMTMNPSSSRASAFFSLVFLTGCAGSGEPADGSGGAVGAGGQSSGGGVGLPTGGSVGVGGAGQTGGSASVGGSFNAGGDSSAGGSNGGASSGGALPGGDGGGPASGGSASGGMGSGGGSTTSACTEGGTTAGFYIDGGKLFDNHCNEFLMRGVNHPHAWYTGYAGHFADIANAGANAVRVVMATGARWTMTSASEVSAIIEAAKQNNLVAILEVHDSTGYAEQADSVHPQDAVDYWKSVQSALQGQEAFVIINIANEPFGNPDSNLWQSFHEGAVQELRTAGFTHTLMVDAPNWGQDWENTMRDGDGAQAIMDADPDKNVIFSVHMYDIYADSNSVSTYLSNFTAKGLPLVVGEFAADHGAGKDVDEGAILEFSSALGVGYLGWSWSGNGDGLGSLDITTDFNASNLTTWGETLINGAYGIKATSELCTCFDF